jgi:hypothetical protein
MFFLFVAVNLNLIISVYVSFKAKAAIGRCSIQTVLKEAYKQDYNRKREEAFDLVTEAGISWSDSENLFLLCVAQILASVVTLT